MTPEQAQAIAAQVLATAPPQLIEEEEPEYIEDDVEETVEETAEARDLTEISDENDEPSDFAGSEEQQPGNGEPREGRGRRRRRRGRGRGGEGRSGEPRREPNGEHQPFAAGPMDAATGEMPAQYEQSDSEHAGEPGEGGFAPQPNGDPNGNGEARHRRRGRRGGRRNRRGRDRNGAPLPENGNDQPHGDFQGGDGNHQDFGQQPDTSHGGGEPRHEHESAFVPSPEPSYAPRPEPVAAQPPSPPPAPAAEPRRRSTVREPAPVGSSAPVTIPTPPPAPEPPPVVTSDGDDASKPRKTGWWAKRLLGGS
jgi:ribonuclease E